MPSLTPASSQPFSLTLTPQVRKREWHHAGRIALGWLLNLCAFVGMLCAVVVYGCAVRSLSAEDNSKVSHARFEPHRP
jgi:hypothetical protein